MRVLVTIPLLVVWLAVLAVVSPLLGVERVAVRRNNQTLQISGELVVEAEDGGLLLRDAEGVLWALQPDEIQTRQSDPQSLPPLGRAELGERILAELGQDFALHDTAHYLVFHDTSKAYAQWCGALFERLYAAFHAYWKHQGLELREPAQPLVALVFAERATYERYAAAELGEATSAIVGYYSLRTNRVTMYDLTRADRLARAAPSVSAGLVNRILQRPEAQRMVATVIHEATHQLAFNCGLQQRYADIPLWVSEGLAVYFETPDLNSSRGWKGIGAVNEARLVRFRQYAETRPQDSLRTLLGDDSRFRQTRIAPDAYAEAWCLNYFLLQRHSRRYVEYLRRLAEKPPLKYDRPEERIRLFEDTLGVTLEQLDAEFLRSMARLR